MSVFFAVGIAVGIAVTAAQAVVEVRETKRAWITSYRFCKVSLREANSVRKEPTFREIFAVFWRNEWHKKNTTEQECVIGNIIVPRDDHKPLRRYRNPES